MSDKPDASTTQDSATIRRAPKLGVFLIIGGGLGAIVTFILTALFPVDKTVGFGALLGYFLLYGIPAGVVVGAVVALILDRRSKRKATPVTVKHESVIEPEPVPHPEPQPEPGPEPGPGAESVDPDSESRSKER